MCLPNASRPNTRELMPASGPCPADFLQEQRRQLDLPENFLLFVGTFEPRKNIAGLLEAWRRLRLQLPDAPPIVLAGRRGWLFDGTMQRIR